MINLLSSLYDLEITSYDEVNKIVFTKDNVYQIVFLADNTKENIFIRLSYLELAFIDLPLLSKNKCYLEKYNQQYLYLEKTYPQEDYIPDLFISFFIEKIALLHQKSAFKIPHDDAYLTYLVTSLNNSIIQNKETLESYVAEIEKKQYYAPKEWYFLANYLILYTALRESSSYLDQYLEEKENLQEVELAVTYLNFDQNHLLLKQNKIISLKKMNYHMRIFDLIDFFHHSKFTTLNVVSHLIKYHQINPLTNLDIYLLLSYLFNISFSFSDDDINDIEHLYYLLKEIKLVQELKGKLIIEQET
jgi:hypothetical protein